MVAAAFGGPRKMLTGAPLGSLVLPNNKRIMAI
jgi:hypothetical protein